jgi:hypothetical protein
MLRLRSLTAILTAAVVLTACSDSPTGGSGQIEGTYSIHTINGSSLPYTLFQFGNDKFEVLSGSMTLQANGTFTQTFSTRETEEGVTTTETSTSSGTWSRTGNTVVLASQGEQVTMTWDGNRQLTWVETDPDFGLTFTVVFRK